MNAEAIKKPQNWTAPAAAIGTAAGAYAGLQALNEVPPWVQELIKTQGSDFLVAFIILGAAIYFAPKFIKAQTDQALALHSVAETMKNLPQKDHMKFEEILIGQEMLNRSLDRVHRRLDDLARNGDGKN